MHHHPPFLPSALLPRRAVPPCHDDGLPAALYRRQLFITVIEPMHGWNIDENGAAWRVIGVLNFRFLKELVGPQMVQTPIQKVQFKKFTLLFQS